MPEPIDLDDRVREVLADASTVLDEADSEAVVQAVLPLLRQHGAQEYERGIRYGSFSQSEKIARHLGLDGRLVPDA